MAEDFAVKSFQQIMEEKKKLKVSAPVIPTPIDNEQGLKRKQKDAALVPKKVIKVQQEKDKKWVAKKSKTGKGKNKVKPLEVVEIKPVTKISLDDKGVEIKPVTKISLDDKGVEIKPVTKISLDDKGVEIKPVTKISLDDKGVEINPVTKITQEVSEDLSLGNEVKKKRKRKIAENKSLDLMQQIDAEIASFEAEFAKEIASNL